MNKIEEAREAFRQSLPVLARQVARGLGEGWRGEPGYHGTTGVLHGPDDAKLIIAAANWKTATHIEVSGQYPDKAAGLMRLPNHYIRMAATRDVAKEIQRRLLPEYLVNLALAKETIGRHSNANDARNDLAQKIRSAASPDREISIHMDDDAGRTKLHAYSMDSTVSGDLELSGDGTYAYLTFSGASEKLIAAFLAILAPNGQEGEAIGAWRATLAIEKLMAD